MLIASLNGTQSALSRSIRKLEASLGTALFERTSRRVELTAAGLALLEDAQNILGKTALELFRMDD